MSVFSDLIAMNGVNRIKKGGRAKLSISQITGLITNMMDARNNLTKMDFEKVYTLFKQLRTCKTKIDMGKEEYCETALNIIEKFDKIAPYSKYSGGNEYETSFLMDGIAKENNNSASIDITPKYEININEYIAANKKKNFKKFSEYKRFEQVDIDIDGILSNQIVNEDILALDLIYENEEFNFYLCKSNSSYYDLILRQSKDNKHNVCLFDYLMYEDTSCFFKKYFVYTTKSGEFMHGEDMLILIDLNSLKSTNYNFRSKYKVMKFINGYGREYSQDSVNTMYVKDDSLIIELHREKIDDKKAEYWKYNMDMDYSVRINEVNGELEFNYSYRENKKRKKVFICPKCGKFIQNISKKENICEKCNINMVELDFDTILSFFTNACDACAKEYNIARDNFFMTCPVSIKPNEFADTCKQITESYLKLIISKVNGLFKDERISENVLKTFNKIYPEIEEVKDHIGFYYRAFCLETLDDEPYLDSIRYLDEYKYKNIDLLDQSKYTERLMNKDNYLSTLVNYNTDDVQLKNELIKIKSGKCGSLSISQITYSLANMSEAFNNLDLDEFNNVYNQFIDLRKDTCKHEMNYDEYLKQINNVIKKFNKLADMGVYCTEYGRGFLTK